MNSSPFALPRQLVADDLPTGTQFASGRFEALSASLPACLFQYARSEAWASVPLSALAQGSVNFTKHIFVTDSVLKSHDPNKVFSQLRPLITDDQYVAFQLVTAENIKHQLLTLYSVWLFAVYYPFHFLFRRVIPKLKGFRKISRLLRVPVDMSKAEIVGRLIYTGFELVGVFDTNQETVLVVKRNPASNPSASKPSPSEGFLFRMERVGQHAQPIRVYKLRSMHPYAEYVQTYLHDTHGLAAGGKFQNDFRISTGGKVLRKYWIDEIPMIYNVLRGDLKLIGVRPLSDHYLSLYPESARVLRGTHKPGLIPPFYADLPKTFEEIVESELTYLKAYEQAPVQTDLQYLKRILTNILVHKARST